VLILVDTSVWIDHFRATDDLLVTLLEAGMVALHPFVVGELALGNLRDRRSVIRYLAAQPMLAPVDDADVLGFIDRNGLGGRGIGYVDAHLLAAVSGTEGVGLWTRDRRLAAIALELGVGGPDG